MVPLAISEVEKPPKPEQGNDGCEPIIVDAEPAFEA